MSRLSGRNWRLVVGLTGGLGSGKSTVLTMFRKKGAFTLDADADVQAALKRPEVLKKIRRNFGPEVFSGRQLNRRALAALVFKNARERRKLERLIHPLVRKNFRRKLAKKKGTVAVCDVPLLYERGWPSRFDRVVVVDAPAAVRVKRLKKRGFSPKESAARMRAQWPLSHKVKRADFVIRNGGSIKNTQAQVNRIWDLLMRGSYGIAARTKNAVR